MAVVHCRVLEAGELMKEASDNRGAPSGWPMSAAVRESAQAVSRGSRKARFGDD